MLEDRKIKMRLDIQKVSVVGDIGLNDEVTVTVKGRVTSLRGPEMSLETPYVYKEGKEAKSKKEVERVYPGSLEVEVAQIKIESDGAFAGIDADEED